MRPFSVSLLRPVGLVLVVALGSRAAEPKPLPPVTGERWLEHFSQDLLPFWNRPEAWGEPEGNFPTFRCNDGGRFDPAQPCESLQGAPGWIRAELGRDYVRMKSRQTYFYGVAYHLNGDPRMLALAKAGVDFIRTRALDPVSGSAVSYWEKGVPGPPVLQRTSQDLAYAQLGLAMYYYLTRDEAVLKDILRLKAHIFDRYWDAEWGMLRWVVEDGGSGDAARKELVAQLDQVNAYLLLLAPVLPEPHRSEWKRDLLRLAKVMVEKYHSPERHLFWGTVHDPKDLRLGSRHTDFGHTAKALWMIERIGLLCGDAKLRAFATGEAKLLLAQAYRSDTGSWGSRLRRDGSVDPNKEWWIYAELDQLAATLGLQDPAQRAPLPATQAWWLKHFVDPIGHEVWGWVDGETGQAGGGPKIHHWKSGYHSAEHALVGYLTAQSRDGRDSVLHFALADPKAEVPAYFFTGAVRGRSSEPLPGFPGRQRVSVRYGRLQ